jgi:serine protease inhibitor
MSSTWFFGHLRSEVARGILFLLAVSSSAMASTADQAKLAAADTGFAFGLLNALAKEQPGQNVFISPYSISTVLQMVANGAAGTTRQEMARVLGTSDLEAKALNRAYKDLNKSVRSAEADVALNIANAIWYSVGIEVRPAFASLNKDYYGATLEALDFTDPRTGGIVNAWASKHTQGRIKQIVAGRLPGDTRMLLANAIYFKGNWERQFDAKLTEPLPFHLADGGQKRVPMMRQGGTFEYQEGDGCQAVRLPYKGQRLAMYVLLPETNSSVGKLLATLNGEAWQAKFGRRMQSREGSLVLPRFKLEYGTELTPTLQAMGMKLPFSRAADFSAMSPTPLFLSAVKHKSFVEVNEEGTEAAAVTVGVMSLTAAMPTRPFQMVVDRPFLFVIADNVTRAILFVGVVYEPPSEG